MRDKNPKHSPEQVFLSYFMLFIAFAWLSLIVAHPGGCL